MARTKSVSTSEDLEVVSSKIPTSVKEKLEHIASRAGQKLGVWLRDHLTKVAEKGE